MVVLTRSSMRRRTIDKTKNLSMVILTRSSERRLKRSIDDDNNSGEKTRTIVVNSGDSNLPSERTTLQDLPNEIKVDILRHLGRMDAKQAAIAVSCSTIWRNLVCEIDDVRIVYEDTNLTRKWIIRRSRAHQFVRFVHANISRRERIRTMTLEFRNDIGKLISREGFRNKLEIWMNCAVAKGLEELNIQNLHCISVPDSFYSSCGILRKLRLSCVRVAPPESTVNWGSLEEICLFKPIFADNSLGRVLDGCLNVKRLEIRDCYLTGSVIISSGTIESLLISYIRFDNFTHESGSVEINTPSLVVLEISGRILAQISFRSIPSRLKESIITCGLENSHEDFFPNNMDLSTWCYMVTRLLIAVACAKRLTLGSCSIQCLTMHKHSDRAPLVFSCEDLSIESPLWKFDIPGVSYVLEKSPMLNKLSLTVKNWMMLSPLPLAEVLFREENPHLNMPICNSRAIMIFIDYERRSCFDGQGPYDACFDYQMVDYFIRSGGFLQKLIIYCPANECTTLMTCDVDCSFQHVNQLCSRLIDPAARQCSLLQRERRFELLF